MPHLVESICGPITLAACAEQVRTAHDYLARQGAEAVDRAWVSRDVNGWGAAVKRIRVELSVEGRPERIAPGMASHNLIEVINQCATLERLLDALAWAQTPESGLATYDVTRCHPTTSSAKGPDKIDNDLVLTGPDGVVARFEVSDVASEDDGNQKERRDLISLRALREGRGAAQFVPTWPAERLFLVVSEEFARRLRRPTRTWLKGNPPHCRYQEYRATHQTFIFEVLPGKRA